MAERDRTNDSKIYALENLLVLTMLGSAVALQVLRSKDPENDRTPLLTRIGDAVSRGLLP